MNLEDLFHTLDIGQRHDDLPVETTGPKQCGVEDIGTVCRRNQDYPFIRFKTVHFNEELIERLLPLVVAASQTCAPVTSHRIDLIDEDDTGGVLLALVEEILTRDAPTPTNISTKSEPLMLRKGTSASPAMALASRVFPVPGCPTRSKPLGILPQLCVFLGITEKVDHLLEFGFGLFDPATSAR